MRRETTPAGARKTALRFTGLWLENWRNFRKVKIDLLNLAFFIGANASGKSNLLDAFRFLHDVAAPGSGGLRGAIARRGGVSAIRCLHARKFSDVSLVVTVGDNDTPEIWRYELTFSAKKGQEPAIVVERLVHNDTECVRRTKDHGESDLELTQTHLEQVSKNKDFSEFVTFLASCRYLHVVPQIVRDRRRQSAEGDDPFGGDLLRRIKEMPKKSRDARLKRIARALQIAVPQFESLDLQDDSEGVPHLCAKYRNWRPYATKQSEVAFSDGTLRLIGVLWSIGEKGGPLLLEEPELSLNDAVVGELPAMFRHVARFSGRQILASTHAPALLESPKIGLREVHLLTVGNNGSEVTTLSDLSQVKAQVEGGMTIAEAVLPLLRPEGIEALADLDVIG
ncbi:AAA family ATPase [Acidibrevibacterium fodinaquatile]|uniref:AAA family ATPase n=1 Tax=Acidibrevibacterium fodinaquatile TaxID=1969806 RepID=UPI000E0DD336|nr:AAA family ATPase [Acidibrevibacterium fodinaquatile]